MKTNPLATGFLEAIQGGLFDTSPASVMPPVRKSSTARIEDAARKYQVTPRTIYRWLDAGLAVDDLNNLEAVGSFLLTQRAPKSEAINSIIK